MPVNFSKGRNLYWTSAYRNGRRASRYTSAALLVFVVTLVFVLGLWRERDDLNVDVDLNSNNVHAYSTASHDRKTLATQFVPRWLDIAFSHSAYRIPWPAWVEQSSHVLRHNDGADSADLVAVPLLVVAEKQTSNWNPGSSKCICIAVAGGASESFIPSATSCVGFDYPECKLDKMISRYEVYTYVMYFSRIGKRETFKRKDLQEPVRERVQERSMALVPGQRYFDGVVQAFDAQKFSFDKVNCNEEVVQVSISNVSYDACTGRQHDHNSLLSVYLNAFPFAPLHSLLVPFPGQYLPQVVQAENLSVGLRFFLCLQLRASSECSYSSQDSQHTQQLEDVRSEIAGFPYNLRLSDIRMGFNSLGAGASVNHMHFQMAVFLPTDAPHGGAVTALQLPLETAPVSTVKEYRHRTLAVLRSAMVYGYVLPAIRLEVETAGILEGGNVETIAGVVASVTSMFQERGIPHSLLISVANSQRRLYVYIVPRRKEKYSSGIRSGWAEVSGWTIVTESATFEDIVKTRKWIDSQDGDIPRSAMDFLRVFGSDHIGRLRFSDEKELMSEVASVMENSILDAGYALHT